MSAMEQSLRSRFLRAEEQLFSAFGMGPDAVSAFTKTWDLLLIDLATAQKAHQINSDTEALAHATASRISVLAEMLLSLDVEADKLCDIFTADVDGIILETAEQAVPPCSISSTPSSSPALALDFRTLDSLATRWLLDNIHDPYPPATVKAHIASASGCPVKTVQDWFRDARRTTGWTALSRAKFDGSRRETVDAASRAYAQHNSPTLLTSDVRRAFIAVRANARDLARRGDLAGHFGTANQLEVTAESSLSSMSPFDIHPVIVPQSMPLDDEQDIARPPPIAGTKRPFSTPVELLDEQQEQAILFQIQTTRPSKRQRYVASPSDLVNDPAAPVSQPQIIASIESMRQSVANIPQRPPTEQSFNAGSGRSARNSAIAWCNHQVTDDVAVTDPNPAAIGAVAPSAGKLPRKRRLSDASCANRPKRPRGLVSGLQKQVVSDPLPVNFKSLDAQCLSEHCWLQPDLGVVDAVNMDGASLDAELAKFFALPPAETTSLPFSGATQLDVSDSDLISGTGNGFDLSSFNPVDSMSVSSCRPPFSSIATSSNNSSASSSPSADSTSDFYDYGVVDHWDVDWSQFGEILTSLKSSSGSPQSSFSDEPTSSVPAFDLTTSLTHDDTIHMLFGMDTASISPDLLSEVGELSSLSSPLGVTY